MLLHPLVVSIVWLLSDTSIIWDGNRAGHKNTWTNKHNNKKKKANKHGPPAKQMEVKTNRTEVLRGNHSGHYNMEMKTSVHVTGQHEQHEPN